MPRERTVTIEERTDMSPHGALYRRLAFSFLGVTLALVALLFFLSLWSVTITLLPNAQPIEETFRFIVAETIPEGANAQTVVEGAIEEATFRGSATVPLPTQERREGYATGVVTLVNTTGRAQPLVRTTRLLSPDAILFRTQQQVEVPAHGSVDVAVRADESGVAGDVAPTRFTIPGLNASLQAQIYGESKEPMRGGVTFVGVVTKEDITRAVDAARAAILEREGLRVSAPTDETQKFFHVEVREATTDAKEGAEQGDVTATVALHVQWTTFSRIDLERVAVALLSRRAGSRSVVLPHTLSFTPTLDVIDFTNKRAAFTVHAQADATLAAGQKTLIDRSMIRGARRSSIMNYLRSLPNVRDARLRFSPPFLLIAPFLEDHIEVNVQGE